MRLIDANKLIEHLKSDPLYPLIENYNVDGVIENAPTIDPVVRCKDCENWARDWFTTSGSSDHFCPMMDTFTDPDEFCSRAERITDE